MTRIKKDLAYKLTLQFERTYKVFQLLTPINPQVYTSLRDCYIPKIAKMERDWGTRETLKYLKGLYALYSKYSCKRKCNSMDLPKWSRGDRYGMPKLYKPFTRLINLGDRNMTRFVLSMLRSYEVIELSPVIDFSTITEDTGGAEGYGFIREDFNRFLKTSNLAMGIRKTFNEDIERQRKEADGLIPFHTTLKSGTEGPALATIHQQSLAIKGKVKDSLCQISELFFPQEPLNPILELNQEVALALKGQDVFTVKTVTGRAKTDLGAITFIPDKGGKTRVVAKGNYWVQNTLLPVHKALYNTLRTLSQDGTFRQSEVFERLQDLSSDHEIYASDLSAATDLWPIEMQADVMIFLNETLGTNWKALFEELRFRYNGKTIKYAVGGPMGIYSNWGAFTLTHHFMVLYAFSLTNQWAERTKYGMIGDDNALANKLAALKYKELLGYIKVKINELKTWDPEGSLDGHRSFEFAKRYSSDGVEMTALPPGIINNGFQSIYHIPEVINFMVKHGYSEIKYTSLKKICKCYDVWERNIPKMYVAFHVSGILGSSYDVSQVDNQIYNPGVSNLTVGVILDYRFQRLMENILSSADTKGAAGIRTQDLLKRLGQNLQPDVAENLALNRVFKTQKLNLAKLQRRMAQAIFDKVIAETSDEPFTSDRALQLLQKVEYLTPISFKDLENGITRREEPIHNRGKVLKELVKKSRDLWDNQA